MIRATTPTHKFIFPEELAVNELAKIQITYTQSHSSCDRTDDKIPTQATTQNQLADKDFVNSSIATNTANYISKTVEGKKVPFDSFEELEAYSGTLTNNDYAFVVGTDSEGNTTYTRYKYNENEGSWGEEYVLNNSSFTAVQWAAINSGITSGKIEQIDAAIADIPELLTTTGQSTTAGMTQKAITDALASAGGVKVKTLTTADYNWPEDNPDGIAMWKLETGFYENRSGLLVYDREGSASRSTNPFIISKAEDYGNSVIQLRFDIGKINVQVTTKNGSQRRTNSIPFVDGVANNLTTTGSGHILDARQGKVLKDLIDALEARVSALEGNA